MSNKITTERNQRALLELASQPGNDLCADCKARNPRWASYNLGIFICVNCASIHRKIGTHVSKVKSLTLDSWSKEQIENMKQKGNTKSNSWYNPNEIRNPLPTNYLESERDSELELYIRSKYEHKKFLDRSAVVASHLGPSRSSSTLVPRAQSTPVIERPPPPPSPSSKIQALGVTPEHRPATVALTRSSDANQIRPTRSVSQPLTSLPNPPQQQSLRQKPGNPVWDDLISLQTPNPTPSLPLQYQATPASASFAAPNQTLLPSSNPFNHIAGNSGYSSPTNPVGGYPQVDMSGGVGVGVGMGMGSTNPFQQMQQQQQQQPAQAQVGFNPGPSMFMQSSTGGGNPFAQSYPSQGNFTRVSQTPPPMLTSTPFQQPPSTPSFAQHHPFMPSFQSSPGSQQPMQLQHQPPNSFSQQSTAFQHTTFQQLQQPQQYFPSLPQGQPGSMQQPQQFFQPQPLLQQQQAIASPPFMATPSPLDQQQQQAQAHMYAQAQGWPQGGQHWGGM